MLEEGHEQHDRAVKRRRHLLMARHEPLHRHCPHVRKTALDKALHAHVGNIGTVP
jgi:hypothetical protein